MLQIYEDTVQRYVNAKAEAVTQQVEVSTKPKTQLKVQMDELWSFVDDLGNKQWVWLAIDTQTREIVGEQLKLLKIGQPCFKMICGVVEMVGFEGCPIPSQVFPRGSSGREQCSIGSSLVGLNAARISAMCGEVH